MKIQDIKQQLNRVFDDNLHTRQWENYVDYAIIGLIILSTLQIYLSTFDYMDKHYGTLLKWIDYITVIIFTIEVTLRIWCADLLDDKYKGFMGRVKYCFSFYGFIDLVSTYSFYVALFFPIPYNILKVLRVVRLLRIFRYMKAFTILNRAISSKKDEMTVSLQFLVIVTLMLSFILFFVEHEAQPEVYSNGWKSVLWAFAQYIGDPGNFADTPPITVPGRIIACIIGILGIAIFAVPAGLIASGFSDSMAEMVKEEQDKTNASRIRKSFYVHCNLAKNVRFFPKRIYRFNDISINLGLTNDEIMSAARSSRDLRVRDLANSLSSDSEVKPEMLAVELVHENTSYGFCSSYPLADYDKDTFPKTDSNVTIISPDGSTQIGICYYAYQTARIGQYNLIINECLSSNADLDENRCIVMGIYDYQYEAKEEYPKLHDFVDDIKKNVKTDNDWAILLDYISKPKDAEESQCIFIRLEVDEESENHTIEDTTSITDIDKFKAFLEDLTTTMKAKHNVDVVLQFKHSKDTALRNYLRNKLDVKPNVLAINITKDFLVFGHGGKNSILSVKTLSEVIHRHLETKNTRWVTDNWTSTDFENNRSPLIPNHRVQKQ